MVSPRSVRPSPLTSVTAADLVRDSAGAWVIGVDVEELLDVIVAALGFLPLAVAVLLTTPASTSAWVTVCGARPHRSTEAPGASGEPGQVTAPAIGSVTAMVVSVTEPVFLTRNDHCTLSPRSILKSPSMSVTDADLVSRSEPVWATGVFVDEAFEVTVDPLGLSALAVAVLVTAPASTSA